MHIHYQQNGFEPQIHFSKRGKNFQIEFNDEWVHPTETGLDFFDKEEVIEVSSEPFLARNTFCKDFKNGRRISFSHAFAKKHGMEIHKTENLINNHETEH